MAHLKLPFVLLLIGVTMSAGIYLQKRIVGGKPCKDEERKYHVQLIFVTAQRYNYCGGSLIRNNWILTAAHCLKKIANVQKITAILGIHPKTTVEIMKKPLIYNDGKDHDIMLLQLDKPTDIGPVALPKNCKDQTLLKVVQVAGHGPKTPLPGEKKEGKLSDDLQCIDVNVVKCTEVNHNHVMCYKSEGKDTCPGDSGGGVIFQNQIYGVHQGSFSDIACTEKGYFADVCKYMHWIEENTGMTN